MENSADRFFKGFSLEGYRLQVLMNKLEKEKKQCLNHLREETHVFKMSIKAPVKCGDDCWSQYGEIFHANGDKRENTSITHINMEHNNEENENRDASLRDAGNTSNSQKTSSRMIKIPSESLELHAGVNQTYQRSYLQRTRNKSKKQDTKERGEPLGLTLLDILCGDFENGALLLRKELAETNIGGKTSPDKLGCKYPKQTYLTCTELEKNLHVSDSNKNVQLANLENNAMSSFSKSGLETTKWRDGGTAGNSNSSIGIKLKSVSFEEQNFGSSLLKISSISARCLSSRRESVAVQQRPSKIVNWNFKNTINHSHLGGTGATLRTGGQLTKKGRLFEEMNGLSDSSLNTTQNDKTLFSSHTGLSESGLESQNSENCRFVHFKEGRKPSIRKGRQESCSDRSKGKEKMTRSRSPCTKLFQVEGLQSSGRRKSQDEINKETRQKMDQFFAKVERTKCFQTSKLRWRCSSGVELNSRRSDGKVSLEVGSTRVHGGKKEHGYRRAQPWPTQVWS